MTTINEAEDKLYEDIMSILRDIKVAFSPTDLNATLKKRKDLKNFLRKRQAFELDLCEKRLESLKSMDYNDFSE